MLSIWRNHLFELLEKSRSSVVVNAVFEVEELLNAVLLVIQVSVAGLLLGLGDTLNTLVKVVLERVADALSSLFSQLGEDVFRLIFILVVFVIIFVFGFFLGLFSFFFRGFFFDGFLKKGYYFELVEPSIVHGRTYFFVLSEGDSWQQRLNNLGK